jgi:hypothetical protein
MANVVLHRLGGVALALGLTACAAFEGPLVGEDEHTICYSRLETTPDQLRTLATEACGGADPRFDKQAMDISACPVLVPQRIYFACRAK